MENEAKEKHKEDGMMMSHQAGSGDPAVDKHAAGAAPAAMAPAGAGSAASADHPDQDQDVELFKSLIQQYLGADHGQDEEAAMHMAKETYHEGMASGMSHDEALKCAGYGLKAAHILSKKEAREAAAAMPADGAPAHEASDPTTAMHPDDAAGSLPGKAGLAAGALKEGLPPPKADQSASKSDDGGDGKESHKEAALIRATAENAQLREANRKLQVEMHTNKLLEGCGMSVKTTKAFRDLVKDKKTPLEVDSAWKTFKEAFTESKTGSVFNFSFEKQVPVKEAFGTEGPISGFSDCVKTKEI